MRLLDPLFLTFHGEPVTGRTPARVRLPDGAPDLNDRQRSGVAELYRAFRTARSLTSGNVIGYYHEARRLGDGTYVRMTSIRGQDTIDVIPPPVSSRVVLADTFRGIPADDDDTSGLEALGPSARWIVRDPEMPGTLSPVGPVSGHPGTSTWSSSMLLLNGQPFVVTAGGPGDNPQQRYIWINGQRVDTGLRGVIAACICQADEEEPTQLVVRVISTLQANGTTPRMAAVDLVVIEGAEWSSLLQLRSTRVLFVKATYTATEWRNVSALFDAVGQWARNTVPRFNRAGTQVALIGSFKGCQETFVSDGDTITDDNEAVGVIGMAFDLPSWSMAQRIDQPKTTYTTEARTAAVETVPDTDPPQTYASSGTIAITNGEDQTTLLDIDFNGLDLVYITWRRTLDRTLSVSASGEGSGAGSESGTESTSYTLEVEHSVHGVVYSQTASASIEYSAGGDIDSPTWSITRSQPDYRWDRPIYVGDLARDVFAVGTVEPTARPSSATGSGEPHPYPGTQEFEVYYSPYLFNVWMAGEQVATATSGDMDNDAASTTTDSSATAMFGLAIWPALGLDGTWVEDATVAVDQSSAYDGFNGVLTLSGGGAAAVHARRHIAYLNARDAPDAYGLEKASGLEIVFFKDEEGEVTVGDVPAYAPGPHPTIKHPVFVGLVQVSP